MYYGVVAPKQHTGKDRTMKSTVKLPTWKGTLREWRHEMGINQEEAARELDCGVRRVQAIEAGETKYRLSRPDLVFMAVALAVKLRGEQADSMRLIETV